MMHAALYLDQVRASFQRLEFTSNTWRWNCKQIIVGPATLKKKILIWIGSSILIREVYFNSSLFTAPLQALLFVFFSPKKQCMTTGNVCTLITDKIHQFSCFQFHCIFFDIKIDCDLFPFPYLDQATTSALLHNPPFHNIHHTPL